MITNYHSALIIDDCEDIRFLLSRKLERLGLETDSATSFSDAMELISTKLYDIILIDIILPNESGLEIAKKLRKNINKHTKLIFISATKDPNILLQIKDSHIDAFISKPINTTSLKNNINDLLAS